MVHTDPVTALEGRLRPTLRARALTAATTAVLLTPLAGCGSGAPTPPAAQIHVDPSAGLLDAPLRITVSGLESKHAVTLKATTPGAAHRVYQDSATFTSDGAGKLDLATAAPTSGSYQGANSQGLIWSMRCADCQGLLHPLSGIPITVTVIEDGVIVGSAQLTRSLSVPGVTRREQRMSATGFYGDYFSPAAAGTPRPAVLIFGGSEGGLDQDLEASLLASHGYPTLSLAYFKEPGLPLVLQNIPLEYFVTALTWLSQQPGVDASRLVVHGVSRGSEAALLLGVNFPQLVHGVIALVPSDVALCSSPGCRGAAWTLRGVPLPYTMEVNTPLPTDQPAAVFAVERINGPILMDCGGQDQVWNSCEYADAMQARLASFPHSHTLLTYPNGTHYVGFTVPNFPAGCCQPDDLARIDQWPHLLDFLSHV